MTIVFFEKNITIMTKARHLLLTLALTLCCAINANAQFGLFSALANSNDKSDTTTVMYYDSQNKVTKVTVGDMKGEWGSKKGIYALFEATSNWRMVREFTYMDKPAVIVLREAEAGKGNIGSVEVAFQADKQFNEANELACLVIYDPTGKQEDMFATFRVKKYVSEGMFTHKYHYDIKEFRVDDDTANFVIAFVNDEMPYKNAAGLKGELKETGKVAEPYSTATEKY